MFHFRSRITLYKCVVSGFIQRSWPIRNWIIKDNILWDDASKAGPSHAPFDRRSRRKSVFVVPPNSNRFSDRRRTRQVTGVKNSPTP